MNSGLPHLIYFPTGKRMRQFSEYNIDDPEGFRDKFVCWAGRFRESCILISNGYPDRSTSSDDSNSYDMIAGTGVEEEFTTFKSGHFTSLDKFIADSGDWIFGHLGYDIKNEIEDLSSTHPDHVRFPGLYFFIPRYVFIMKGNKLKIGWKGLHTGENSIKELVDEIISHPLPALAKMNTGRIRGRISRHEYLEAVQKIKEHIHKGEIYEVNFCHEFSTGNAEIDPLQTWLKLIEESPTPFSCYYRLNDKHLLCASPERFIKKTGLHIISQPIKGTQRRGKTLQEDLIAKKLLAGDPKERAENIMITDLVRNDFSKIASNGSVKVNELCGVYSFPRVFQMQSEISADLPADITFTDIIKAVFPMGSMTGAPKIRAMEIIEQYEKSKRGLYSGTIGYISPEMDFDFNVVIRSIQYNQTDTFLSFMVGSAITSLSSPEKEYRECMLKAEAIMKVLKQI
jgi:para-aminobenzoate synthetase component I